MLYSTLTAAEKRVRLRELPHVLRLGHSLRQLAGIDVDLIGRHDDPGDLRVAQETCGGCHQGQTNAVPRSTMTTWPVKVFVKAAVPAHSLS